MKLETSVTSAVDGTVVRVEVKKGDKIVQNDLLLELEVAKK